MSFRGKVGFHAQLYCEGQVQAHPSAKFEGRIKIGSYTYFGEGCLIGGAEIGRYCSIAPNVTIGLGEHPIDTLSTHPFFFSSKNGFSNVPENIGKARDFSNSKYAIPIIGNDVWIGANAVVCRGVKVGDGAVIASGAIVNRDVPDYAVVGGVPAKVLKYRFSNEVIAKLGRSRWWDLDLSFFSGRKVDQVEGLVDEILTEREAGNLADAEYSWEHFRHK